MTDPEEGTLLFVYAADSGLFNTVADIAHKIFSPRTYRCRLCALTHGYFTVRDEWRRFVESLPVACRFMHRDELADEPGIDAGRLPAVYRWRGGRWAPCLSPDDLAGCRDLADLQRTIRRSCIA